MWGVILASNFPVSRYAVETQSRNPGGYTDFTMSEWTRTRRGQLVRRPFLVVETKKAPSRGTLSSWEDAERQLHRYLKGHAETAAMGQTGSGRLYGAVAIGTAVKFYSYNRTKETLNLLRRQQQEYDVRDDAPLVIRRLQQIKNSH